MRGGLCVLPALIVLTSAAPAGAHTVTPLSSLDDFRAICATPDPHRTYSVTLASDGFLLEPYNVSRARLGVDLARGVRGGGRPSFELVLHHIAGVGAGGDSAFDVAVPAGAAEASDLIAAHDRGELRLELQFQLASPSDGSAVCATTLGEQGEGIRAAIEPVAFEMVRGDARIAGGESPRWSALRDAPEATTVSKPRVVVATPTLTATGGRASAGVVRAASALGPRLLGCYRAGLGSDSTLRGPFVAGVEIAPDGHVVAVRAELDGLGSPELTRCVLSVVRASRFPGATDRVSIPLRFTD